ncbi:phage tail tube protein [Roseovarius pacificus]|uniref:phage tail tube protein n=1 Tax=Roseovarius pacificus TaxID=337701 RepID=UPI002A189B67|nr:phage tail tube protein [Roseovarius pacificus]
MTESVSTIGYGDELEWSTDGGDTWTEVKELVTCDVPTHSVDKHERTHMKSPGRTKEYTPGLRDVNDVSFSFNFSSVDYEALFTLETAGTVAMWRHTLSLNDGEATNAVYEYKGFVEIAGATREVQGVTVADATIKRTGISTFTAAT